MSARVTGALLGAALLVPLLVPLAGARAADRAGYDAAIAKATATEAEAGKLQDRWTTTEAVLKQARTAAAAGDYAHATALAQHAQALAAASVVQAQQQAKLWPNAVVR